ncbi:MAG: DNA polymerase I [Bacteroidales bacterium]|nr:DNA polymerase I [Bacteroidales bacterium]
MPGRLFLIDGHALVFKMYYAFLRRPMINSKGADTSILFGFTKYLLELIEREKPTHLAVSFDPPGGTFRNEMYPAYKANRPDTPQLVIDALEPLTEIVRAMNIPVLMEPGFEADDVIGSMAVKAAAEGMDVYMVTPDKDYGQLISDHIWQYKPGRAGGDDEIIGVPEICARYGIDRPEQVIDMLTICGDASDNVPGVKGIGEVWAGKLVSQYGTLESIYAHIDALTQKQRDMFVASRPYIDLSKKLVTIKTDVPLDVTLDDMAVNMDYSPVLADLFEKYEFNSLKRFISHIDKRPMSSGQKAPQLDVEETSAVQVATAVCSSGRCAFVVDTAGPGIFAPVTKVTVAALTKDGCIAAEAPASQFKAILEDPTIIKFGFDIKYQMDVLAHAGISIVGKLRDVELMHYLLDPEKAHKLEILSKSYLGVDITQAPAVQKEVSLFDEIEEDEAGERNRFREAAAILLIGAKVWTELQEAGIVDLYENIEEPLIRVLSRMECTGVKVDVPTLMEYADSLRAEIAENESVVRQIAGDPELNVSSPKQLGELLFEKLKLDPKAKKSSKGTWSTDEDTLVELADESPVIDAILDFRAAKKLLSTYIEPFPKYISPVTGRIHTTFNQALTSTGRLSSSNPNLQNIPIRTDRGRYIRKAFVAQDPESVIVSADYSQIELRIMAHLCRDEHLIHAFREGIDVHAATAAKIFHLPVEAVSADQRRIAKTANFGIMYGISAFGLAQRLRIPRGEAKKIIEDYFASFPAIRSFIDNTVAAARENGYVETLFGRRRYIPDINSKNMTLRALAERNAVNAPIQGTSADIIKIAMIRIDRRLRESAFSTRMVLQIHDELLFEAPLSEVEALKEMVVSEMEGVIKLSVPLTVECKDGKNWLEAH